ncbi:hypothetical protein BDZ85DRAFT_127531 [Elsinoe ampelina]|uniref:Heterokaryon incompatibility domain-containing protein n=1 Tax=Elsinoe ampelina TaxID=302913 RepID=A0A6A6G9J2_9PEZI|nr:hypothetical protein BDZ85DRAFT_127531 [Elsinoe ampelina]
MEHLPRHRSFQRSTFFPDVPYLSPPSHISTLITLLHSSPTDALQEIYHGVSGISQCAAAVQHSVYFGLLAAWSGKPVDLRQWSATDPRGQQLLNTHFLNPVLAEWTLNYQVLTGKARLEHTNYLRRLLSFVARICDACVIGESDERGTTSSPSEGMTSELELIKFSIRILVATLELCLESVTPVLNGKETQNCRTTLRELIDLDDERLRLLALAGWCPHQVRLIWSNYAWLTALYLLSLERTQRVADEHLPCLDQVSCSANALNMASYKSRHRSKDCGCLPVTVDEKLTSHSIQQGEVPLVVSASGQDLEDGQVNFENRKASTRYMTVSHVWADGLGNPFKNSMPSCEFEQLQHQLREMPKSHNTQQFDVLGYKIDWPRQSFERADATRTPPVWIDALCIPVYHVYAPQRRKAIAQMASIYAGAEQNLVLDRELQAHRLSGASATEILARVIVSNWMTRCWTLQEGVLSRECVFQFADGAIDPMKTWSSGGPRFIRYNGNNTFPTVHQYLERFIYGDLYNILWNKLREDTKTSNRPEGKYRSLLDGRALDHEEAKARHTALKRITMDRNNDSDENHFRMLATSASRCEKLVSAWNELAQRSTTKKEDVATILANLMDFHVYGVQRINGDGQADKLVSSSVSALRMRSMLLSFEELPLSLLSQEGWAEQPHGLTWIPIAPASLLSHPQDTMAVLGDRLVVQGVKVSAHRLLLVQAPPLDKSPYFIRCRESAEQYCLDMKLLRQKSDMYVNDPSNILCLIMPPAPSDKSSNLPRKVAVLRITSYNSTNTGSKTSQHINLHAHYLGCITAICTTSTDTTTTTTSSTTTTLPLHWSVHISLGTHLPAPF